MIFPVVIARKKGIPKKTQQHTKYTAQISGTNGGYIVVRSQPSKTHPGGVVRHHKRGHPLASIPGLLSPPCKLCVTFQPCAKLRREKYPSEAPPHALYLQPVTSTIASCSYTKCPLWLHQTQRYCGRPL